jgi:hypothetical protein
MPFNELQRRDSWPPTVLRLHDATAEDTKDIDEDPFSFFLTSPDDVDLDDDEDLSAGIESSSKPTPVRSISPSEIQKHSPPSPSPLPFIDSDEDEEYDYGLSMPLSLKDFTARHTNDGRQSRSSQRAQDGLAGLGIMIPDHQLRSSRGRPVVRLSPRGRGQTRSLSARRAHSWRVPSPDLGSIREERESDEEKGDAPLLEQEMSVSAPVTSQIEQAMAAKPKKKKRVHWAF